ncbi:hypothetical protein HanXRQr2_Chr16g0761741 [Helianthus annuus]|uniref:Uncharacterized protein n=1 Tax=Helianthus annuus TaxID=4232 RepID=A0A251UEM9_HELAN|nr:uncharacterized protein LOC110867429 [Helianthus annuus]KAF5761151.1 hypothetical protein HanXRQr2_Chr16g0761741 [Helianthus annuus]
MISVILLRRHHLRLPLPVTGRPDAAGIVTATHRLTQLPFLLFISQVCQSYFGGFDLGVSIRGLTVTMVVVAEQGWEVVAEWRWAADVEVVAEEVVSGGRREEGEKR